MEVTGGGVDRDHEQDEATRASEPATQQGKRGLG